MATRKSAARTTAPAARKSPAKATARVSEGKAEAKDPAKKAAAPGGRAAAPAAVIPATKKTAAAPAVTAEVAVAARTEGELQSAEARYRWIAHAAYLRAEKRGFAPGHEIDDWLAAEADFEAARNRGAG